MSKPVIKSIFLLAALCLTIASDDLAAASRKKEKQRTDDLSYQQATGTASPVGNTVIRDADGKEWVNPNATIVRGTPKARLSPAQQLVMNLNERKLELQKQVDLLGAELQTARGSRARKITKELDILAEQIAIVDRKLAAMPKSALTTIPDVYAESKPFHQFVDSLVDKRINEEGYVKEDDDSPATDSYKPTVTPAIQKIVYRVQIAVMTRPNAGAYTALGDVKELQRPDGKYAYYYGTYPSYAEAQAACKRLRTKAQYRDAFVVAMQGTRRLSLQEASQMSAIR